ncbi:hypothetical protein LCGC14_0353740 [marine sediment metagenome]|uniref:Uncharacterized protein n=1 Tax=marine sediment metagenome TaxID=412755 RepID=A0A0F9TT60_9ZZZZ
MSGSEDSAPRDMYGHPIHPLGETGFGVSVTFHTFWPDPNGIKCPYFSIFHETDDFRQSLFSAEMNLNGPRTCNVFWDRITEHFANESWPLGASRWGRDATLMSGPNTPIAFNISGFPIYPLGETGFGVAIWFPASSHDAQTRVAHFAIFHQSDNYRQYFFSAVLMNSEGPQICDSFPQRIADFFANQMSLLGAPSLREGGL